MIKIIEYNNHYYDKVIQHIFEIENDEFSLNLTINDQPDLLSIETNYQNAGGNFWIAIDKDDNVIGTIALYNLGQHIGDLRRMFVRQGYRGKELGISNALLDILNIWAKQNGFKKIYLETTSVFKAAIKFYTKNGFTQIERNLLPHNFPVTKVAKFFFVRELKN